MSWPTGKPSDNVKDLRGQVFGFLVPIAPSLQVNRRTPKKWWVLCQACDNLALVNGRDMTRGHSKSCGCRQFQHLSSAHSQTTHGHSTRHQITKLYECWGNMKSRCLNPKNAHYKSYGGRGIKICARWMEFENFLEDMGEPPEGLTIDRINNDGNYEPGNCRWATRATQVKNRRPLPPLSKERRRQISLSNMGRRHSEETKRKISETNKATKQKRRVSL